MKHESRLLGPQIRFGHLQGPGCSVANARKLLFRRSGRINVNKLLEKTKEELLALLPPTIYFFIALHIVALVRALMAQGTGLPISSSAQIAMGALILGKAVLLADLLPAINRFPDKPLAYNVAWKTTIYFVIATFIHYLERLIDYWKHSGGFAAANERLLAEIVWPPLLGHSDHSCHSHIQLLRGAGTQPHNRGRQNDGVVLRTPRESVRDVMIGSGLMLPRRI